MKTQDANDILYAGQRLVGLRPGPGSGEDPRALVGHQFRRRPHQSARARHSRARDQAGETGRSHRDPVQRRNSRPRHTHLRRPVERSTGKAAGEIGRRSDERDPPEQRTRPGRSWLAEIAPQFLVCRIPGSGTRALRSVASHQRGSRRPGCRVRHTRPSRHGNRELRARGRVGAQGFHRFELGDSSRATCNA